MKKPMTHALLAGLLVCAAGMTTARANIFVTFSVDMATNFAAGTFNPPPPDGTGTNFVSVRGNFQSNAWSLPGMILVRQGNTTIYTNTYSIPASSKAPGTVASYRFNLNGVDPAGNESTASWDNRAVNLPGTDGASLVLPTPFYGDVGAGSVVNVTFQIDMSEQVALGRFTNGVSALDLRGSFNGWANTGASPVRDTSILVTNYNAAFPPGGIVTSNVYVLTIPITTGAEVPGTPATNAFMEWKAVMNGGTWESGGTNFDDSGNRFWVNNTNKVLPLVSFNDQAYAPLVTVRLNVDMTPVSIYDIYYVYPSVVVWGTYDGWSTGTFLTNNPSAANTNIFSGVITTVQGATDIIQYRYTNSYKLANGLDFGWVYDYSNGVALDSSRRTISVPAPITYTNMPVVFFNDFTTNDYLNTDTVVTFSVNMTNAVGTEPHNFDPAADQVYINGGFDYAGWFAWNPIALSSRVCTATPPDSEVYTYQYTFPYGHARRIDYQYTTSAFVNNTGDETLSGLNHERYIRSTNGVDTLPMDTFGVMTAEQKFGSLAIGSASGGRFPVTWLGYPGVSLQSSTSLSGGAWTDNPATAGLSSTNWPNGGGNQFFRLKK
jgi:hypothetical protein